MSEPTSPSQVKGAMLSLLDTYGNLVGAEAAAEATAAAQQAASLEITRLTTERDAALAELDACRNGGGIVPVSTWDIWRGSGVCTKSFYGNVYAHTERLAQVIVEGGWSFVREAVATKGPARTRQREFMRALQAHGIGWHATICQLRDVASFDEAQVRAYAKQQVQVALRVLIEDGHGPYLRWLEPANEVDNVGDCGPWWARNAAIVTGEVARQAVALGLRVTAPSTRTDLNASRAAELSLALAGEEMPPLSMGNVHCYYHTDPGAKLAAMLSTATPISGSNYTVIGETGTRNNNYDAYGTWLGGRLVGEGMPVPESVSAVLGVRTVLESFNQGAAHCRFELLDDPDPTGKAHGAHLGVVAMTKPTVAESVPGTWRRKPEYYALAKLHEALRVGGEPDAELRVPGLAPRPVSYTVTAGATDDVQHVLAQRGDGSMLLFLWRDVEVFRASRDRAGQHVTVEPVGATVTFATGRTIDGNWVPAGTPFTAPVMGSLVTLTIT